MPDRRPTLVLLHPFPFDASFWGPVWRELDVDATLITPEFPGFGSAPAEDAPSIAGFAATVADDLRAEGLGPAVVVGLSLGGYVALALAAEHPDVVGGLALANTKATADDPAARTAREQGIDTIRVDGLATYLDSLLPRTLSPTADADVWERVAAIVERQDPESVCAALEALRDRPDRSAALAAIDVPTVIITAPDDVITPAAGAQDMAAAIPGARVVSIEGAGHLSGIERPGAFAAALRELLARVSEPQ